MDGPPYLAPVAMPGLVPNTTTDIPVASVLMAIFFCFTVASVLLIRQNRRDGVPFPLTTLIIIYSVLRIVGMALRIAYAATVNDTNLTIAANVLSNAGGILIIILNLLLAPKLFIQHIGQAKLAARPGLRKMATVPFFAAIPLVPIFLLITVNVVILSFFTTDTQVRLNCLTAQKVALTVFAVIAFIPVIPSLALSIVSASTTSTGHVTSLAAAVVHPKPGFSSTRSNARLLLFGSVVLTLGTAVRAAGLLLPARAATDPGWYQERPAYYIFTFVTEVIVVGAYLLCRFDRRFQPRAGTAPSTKDAMQEEEGQDAGTRSAEDGALVRDEEDVNETVGTITSKSG